jgi:hypothetical protein
MLRDQATTTRTAARPVLAHERAVRHPSRRTKAFDCACLGLAFFGTASTVAAWQAPPPPVGIAIGGPVGDRADIGSPSSDTLDLGAFLQIAGR